MVKCQRPIHIPDDRQLKEQLREARARVRNLADETRRRAQARKDSRA